jgi:hypothetical protein
MNLKESIKKILEVDVHRNIVDKFAREQYQEKYGDMDVGAWSYYKGYKVISEKLVQINYEYGYGDMQFSDSFTVDLTPFYRDENLKNIL